MSIDSAVTLKRELLLTTVRPIDELADLYSRKIDQIEEVMVVVDREREAWIPQIVRDFEELLRRSLSRSSGTKDDALEMLLNEPLNGPVAIDYGVLEDGRIIQEMRTTLRRRKLRRESRAFETAERAGLHATLKVRKRDWGHIIPDVLGGPDKVFNLVLMSDRFNRSVYKNLDRTIAMTPELEGIPLRVFVEFPSIRFAQMRIATRIVWELPRGGCFPARFIVFGVPLAMPVETWNSVMRSIDSFAKIFRKVGGN